MVAQRGSDGEALQALIDKHQAEIKAEWGAAYDSRHDEIKQLLSAEGVPEGFSQAFNEGRLGVDEMKWLYSIANAVAGEDTQLSGQRSASDNITPGEAAEAIL